MAKNTKKDMRVFGIAMAVVLSGIGVWQLLKDRPTTGIVFLSVGIAFALLALFAVPLLKPLYVPWMKLAFVLGFVMTRVVLTVFYFLVLAPVGLVRRLFGLDGLDRRVKPDATTQWHERDPEPPPRTQYERQF